MLSLPPRTTAESKSQARVSGPSRETGCLVKPGMVRRALVRSGPEVKGWTVTSRMSPFTFIGTVREMSPSLVPAGMK